MSFGSKRWFKYVTDAGVTYGKELDESNTELINPTAAIGQIDVGTVGLPNYIKPRRVFLSAADGSTKSVVVLRRADYDAIAIGENYTTSSVGEENPSVQYNVVRKTPELLRRAPNRLDTGKTDGDQPT